MRRLLKNTTQRRLAIIGVLRDLIGWQNPEMIADLLDCSMKTILSDVESINEAWGEHVGVEYSRTNGLRLNEALHNKTRQLARNLMEESEAFIFLERIFFQPNENMDFWIKELYISEATFYRMIKQIDEVLKDKGLSLERRPFRITAPKERWVRAFYVQLFLEKYGLSEWPFNIEREKVIKFVEIANEAFDISYNDREILESSYLLGTIILRSSQGFTLSEDEKLLNDRQMIDQIMRLRPAADQIVQNTSYSVLDDWCYEVANSLFCACYLTRFEPSCQITLSYLDVFLNELEQAFNLSLTKIQRQKLLQKLLKVQTTYQVCPFPKMILFDSAAYFSRNAKSQYPHFTKYVHQLLLQLERKSGDPWFSFFYFQVLMILFKEWDGLAHSLDLHSTKVKILVISDSGESHAKMLAELIRDRFYYRVVTDTYKGSSLDFQHDARFKKYDLVIANYPIKDYSFGNLKIVDDFLAESDLSAIGSFVKDIR